MKKLFACLSCLLLIAFVAPVIVTAQEISNEDFEEHKYWVHQVLQYHRDKVSGAISDAEASGSWAAFKVNLWMHKMNGPNSLEYHTYYYAMHGEKEYIKEFGKDEKGLASVRQFISDIESAMTTDDDQAMIATQTSTQVITYTEFSLGDFIYTMPSDWIAEELSTGQLSRTHSFEAENGTDGSFDALAHFRLESNESGINDDQKYASLEKYATQISDGDGGKSNETSNRTTILGYPALIGRLIMNNINDEHPLSFAFIYYKGDVLSIIMYKPEASLEDQDDELTNIISRIAVLNEREEEKASGILFRGYEWYTPHSVIHPSMKRLASWASSSSNAKIDYYHGAERWGMYSGNQIDEGGVRAHYSDVPVAGYTSDLNIYYLYPFDDDGRIVRDDDMAEMYFC